MSYVSAQQIKGGLKRLDKTGWWTGDVFCCLVCHGGLSAVGRALTLRLWAPGLLRVGQQVLAVGAARHPAGVDVSVRAQND